MTPQDIRDCWNEVFPNSTSSATQAHLSIRFRGYLAKDVSECSNHIMDNDPLMYIGHMQGGGWWVENLVYMYIKPTEPHMAYSTVRLRRKATQNATREKLIKRFQEVRKFVMDNAHNLKDPMFDITTK